MISRALTSLIFPHYCPSCGREWFEGNGFICSACWKNLDLFTGYGRIAEPDLKERSMIAFAYNDTARLLVQQMKFFGRVDIAEKLGTILFQRFYPQLRNTIFEAVVPVPLHPVRMRERGFNQSAVIAGNLAVELKTQLRVDLLTRIRNTRPQSRLSNLERKNNVIGAFAPRLSLKNIPTGTVLIVDDVFHTGSTLKGCIEALSDIGIEDVRILAAFG